MKVFSNEEQRNLTSMTLNLRQITEVFAGKGIHKTVDPKKKENIL